MHRKIQALALAATLIATSAAAQDDACQAVLRFGVWETFNQDLNVDTSDSFANWACANQERADGVAVTIPIEGVPVKLGYDTASSSASCSSAQGKSTAKVRLTTEVKKASETIVKAWQWCMGQKDRVGSYASISFGSSPELVSIALNTYYKDGRGTVARVKVTPQGGLRQCGELSAPINSKGEKSIGCVRADISQALQVNVNFDDGFKSVLNVQAFKPTPPRPTGPDLAHRLQKGAWFTLTFKVPNDLPCGAAMNAAGNKLGDVQSQSAYRGHYDQSKGSWQFIGPNGGLEGCPRRDHTRGGPTPLIGRMHLWGMPLSFTADGRVRHGKSAVGRISVD